MTQDKFETVQVQQTEKVTEPTWVFLKVMLMPNGEMLTVLNNKTVSLGFSEYTQKNSLYRYIPPWEAAKMELEEQGENNE